MSQLRIKKRKYDRRAAMDHALCGEFSPEEQAWLLRRREFIDSLPDMGPQEVLHYLEDPRRLVRAVDFHRLKRAVLTTPGGLEVWDAFGRLWLALYGGGLPATWWHGWPPHLRVYGGQ
jgi:hypothetical protein